MYDEVSERNSKVPGLRQIGGRLGSDVVYTNVRSRDALMRYYCWQSKIQFFPIMSGAFFRIMFSFIYLKKMCRWANFVGGINV